MDALENYYLSLMNSFAATQRAPYDHQSSDHGTFRTLAYLAARDRTTRALATLPAERRGLLKAYAALLAQNPAGVDLATAIEACLGTPRSDEEEEGKLLSRSVLAAGDTGAALRRKVFALEHEALARHSEEYTRLLAEPRADSLPGNSRQQEGLEASVLAGLLAGAIPGVAIEILDITPINGGNSKQTFLFSARIDGAVARFVARVDTDATYSASSVVDEYAIIRTIFDAGVAVPEPVGVGHLPNGRGIVVFKHVAGAIFGSCGDYRLHEESLFRELGVKLAGIHGLPASDFPNMPGHDKPPSAQLGIDIDFCQDNWANIEGSNVLVDFGFAWLKDNIAIADNGRSIVHGDYGAHNALAENGRINAILDWEFVKIGNPAEDLGYIRSSLERVGAWDVFVEGYRSAGAVLPPDDVMAYFYIYSLTRQVVNVMLFQAYSLGKPGLNSVVAGICADCTPMFLLNLSRTLLATDEED